MLSCGHCGVKLYRKRERVNIRHEAFIRLSQPWCERSDDFKSTSRVLLYSIVVDPQPLVSPHFRTTGQYPSTRLDPALPLLPQTSSSPQM